MKKTFVSDKPKISIKYDGKGDLLIFLHGIGGNKDNWNLNLPILSKHFLCVAWDTRGYGESEDYEGELSFDDIINDLLKLYKYFDKDEAHIIGLSMGGQIACLFYEKYPDKVQSMILCNTHFGLGNLEKEEIEKFINIRKKPLLRGLQPKDIALPVSKSLIGNLNNKVAIDDLVDSMNKLHKESYLKTIDASMSTFHDHIFSKIDVPTLIIVGEKDKLTPPSMALKIQKLIKNSKFLVIDGVGHLTNIESPKIFNDNVLQFLKRV
tara:strand:+ start:253 stop:1047 length:795 start_codon:yes stop_codon:yes gene_type:complete